MNCFWGNVFDYFKERRMAGFFFATLTFLAGLLVAGWLVYQLIRAYNLQDYVVYALPVAIIILCIWAGRSLSRARERWRYRYKSSPMSCDELRKARSKLLRSKY
jgi:hypothetical protein